MIDRERNPEYEESSGEIRESTFGRTGPTGYESSTRDTNDNLVEMARQRGSQATGDVKEKTGQLVDEARHKASANMSGQMNRAADGLGSIAQAVRHTGQQLRSEDKSGIAGYADAAADQVERFSTYLRDSDFEDVVHEVEQIARRQPFLFLGGAFLAGFLGARFLKSSSPSEDMGIDYRRRESEQAYYRRQGYGTTPSYGSRPGTGGYGTPGVGTPPATTTGPSPTGGTTGPESTRPVPPAEHTERTDEAA